MAGTEFGPSRVETDEGTMLFFSSGGAPGSNTQDMMPNVSKDGREVVLASNRPGGQGSFDVWASTRASVHDAWSEPVNLGTAVNTDAAETRRSLSWRGERLYFGRAGVIFVSTRTTQTGPPS